MWFENYAVLKQRAALGMGGKRRKTGNVERQNKL